MVRALLRGRKTMTRRLAWTLLKRRIDGSAQIVKYPSPWQKVDPGDRLWVREACGTGGYFPQGWAYRADGVEYPNERWRPSIHMPRRASRLTLTVTSVKIEPLQSISEGDAKREGCAGVLGPNPDFPDEWDPSPQEEFQDLWHSLHGACAWDANPEVVALTFTVQKANIDQVARPA